MVCDAKMPFQTQMSMPQGSRPEFEQERTSVSEQEGSENNQRSDLGQQQGEGIHGNGNLSEMNGIQKGGASNSNVLWNLLKGLSIVYFFAAITTVLDSMIKRKVARRTTTPDAQDEICS
jgi:hypothetical protein